MSEYDTPGQSSVPIFVSRYWNSNTTIPLTQAQADSDYVKLTGGTITGDVEWEGTQYSTLLSVSGSLYKGASTYPITATQGTLGSIVFDSVVGSNFTTQCDSPFFVQCGDGDPSEMYNVLHVNPTTASLGVNLGLTETPYEQDCDILLKGDVKISPLSLPLKGISGNGNLTIAGGNLTQTGTGTASLKALSVPSLSCSGDITVTGSVYSVTPLLVRSASQAQTVVAAVWTDILFQTEDINQGVHGLTYNNGIFTNSSGSTKMYTVTAWISSAFVSGSSRRVFNVVYGPSSITAGRVSCVSTVGDLYFRTTVNIKLLAGETFKVVFYHTANTDVNTIHTSSYRSTIQIESL